MAAAQASASSEGSSYPILVASSDYQAADNNQVIHDVAAHADCHDHAHYNDLAEVDEFPVALSNSQLFWQLSFKRGDRFTLIENSSEHWWWCEARGREERGYVPVNHITVLNRWEIQESERWQDDEYFGGYGHLVC